MIAAVLGVIFASTSMRIEIEGLVDLGQDRRGAGVHDRGDRGDVGEAGHDHLVPRPDTEAEQSDPERR